jgi:alanine racemase
VVKADAYGCGTEPVVTALYKAGCRTFFTAHLSEARRARMVAPEATIYVLNGLAPNTGDAYARDGLRPVLGSLSEFDEWRGFVASTGWSGSAALHIDTGMNRLGLTLEEAAAVAEGPHTGAPSIALLMSHLACAELPEHPLNAKQLGLFQDMRALFPGIAGSLANSSGIFLSPDAHHDLVRPGVALYGANPTPGHMNPMQPVVKLEGRFVQVRDVAAGDTVGYGATWTAARDSRVAIISIGYGDGLLRSLSRSGAEVSCGGKRCPLVGRISMDLCAVDVTDAPKVQRGDLAAFLDEKHGVDDLAAHAGTIGYEILTSLGRRYRRVYRGG